MRKLQTFGRALGAATVLLGFGLSASAQQDPMFTKYMFNSLAFNPAYAGTHGYLSSTVLVRDQWLSWNKGTDSYGGGAPMTYTANVHSPFKRNTGLGAYVSQDRIGSTAFTGIDLSYAYRLRVTEDLQLSLGLQGGLTHLGFDYSGLRIKDGDDDTFDQQRGSGLKPNAGAGAYLYGERFYLGGSIPRLFESRMLDMDSETQRTQRDEEIVSTYRHLYIASGAAFPLRGDNLVFKPSMLIKGVGWFGDFRPSSQRVYKVRTPTEVDLDLSLLFNQVFWVGASFRTTVDYVFWDQSSHDSADLWMALFLKNGLRVGMAYDYSLTRLQQFGNGSAEVMLGYDMNFKPDKIVTPRYF